MGNITDSISTAFRDYEVDGVASSGAHDVVKSDVRAVGPIIESAIANAGLGALVSVTYATKAELDADLAHADSAIGLVYADATDANNDLYLKVGASGAGSWTLTTTLHDIIEILAQPYVDEAAASAALLNDRFRVDLSNPDTLLQVLDADGNVAASIDLSAVLFARLAIGDAANGLNVVMGVDGLWRLQLGTVEGSVPLGSWTTATDYVNPDIILYLTSSDGKVLFEVTRQGFASEQEIAAARGSQATLGDRLDVETREDGTTSGVLFGADFVRRTRARVSQLHSSVADKVLSIALIGDSWTDNNYFEPILTTQLRAMLGDAGDGFIPAIRSGANGVTLVAFNTFTATNTATGGAPTPGASLAAWTSSDTAGPFMVTYTASQQQDQAFLHCVGNGCGIEYRKDGGTWHALTIAGAALTVTELPLDGAYTVLDIRLTSGTIEFVGVEGRKAGPGIRIHNLGAGSATMTKALSCDETDYVTALAALQPDLIIAGWGTNEAGQEALSADDFETNLAAMFARYRAAAPLADILLWSPAQSLAGTYSYLMPGYTKRSRTYAFGQGVAHMDGQRLFGDTPTDYGDAGLQFMGSGDDYHPTALGSHMLASAFRRAIIGD